MTSHPFSGSDEIRLRECVVLSALKSLIVSAVSFLFSYEAS